MFCKQCSYCLEQLDSHCCPECGRAFDPGDKKSFLTNPNPFHRTAAVWFAKRLAVPLVLLLAYSAAYSQLVETGYKVTPVTQPVGFLHPQVTLAQCVPVYAGADRTSGTGRFLRAVFAPAHQIDRAAHPQRWNDVKTSLG